MGLISRVSSRTYRRQYFEYNNLNKTLHNNKLSSIKSRKHIMAYNSELLERQNNELQDRLADTVRNLKQVSIGFKQDVDEQNSYLDSMSGDFSSAQGLLSGTVKRVNWMVNSGGGNRKLMMYTVLAIVSLFFVIYYLLFSNSEE